ncbi:MAG: FAD:protein FMN transferase [Marinilabiliaceae bacterium]
MKKDGNQTFNTQVHHQHAWLMNTRLDIILWGVPADEAEHISQKMISAGQNLQKVLDRFDPEAETSLVNHQALHRDTPVSPFMMEVLSKCMDYYKKTQGAFNVFAGQAYDALKKRQNSEKKISDEHPGENVIINQAKQTVRFTSEHVSLDFGGIGKGMLLDQAAEILDQKSQINAFISFGGSSVLTRGRHPHGEFWPFSFREHGITDTWRLTDDALSISQTRTKDGTIPHIWNVSAKNIVTKSEMVCVQSTSATDAEVLSTALIASPGEMKNQIISAFSIKNHKIYNLIP